jgi:hypothetical protein
MPLPIRQPFPFSHSKRNFLPFPIPVNEIEAPGSLGPSERKKK